MIQGSNSRVLNGPYAVLCRLKFAEYEYMRTPKDGPEAAERTVVFLVDAHAVAVPDQEAIDTLANATSAAHAEIEAKKVCQSSLPSIGTESSLLGYLLVIKGSWAHLGNCCMLVVPGSWQTSSGDSIGTQKNWGAMSLLITQVVVVDHTFARITCDIPTPPKYVAQYIKPEWGLHVRLHQEYIIMPFLK